MLTSQQLVEFGQRGFLLVPGVVDEQLLRDAECESDAMLVSDPPPPGHTGKFDHFRPPEQFPCADRALRESGAMALAEQLVAPHRLHHGLDHIQVSINVPSWSHIPGGPHLDGHRSDQERPTTFTMLAGIYLCDESAPHTGNLWVWPGSHLTHEELFRTRGARALLETNGHATMLEPPLALGPAEPVLARRGDLLLAHMMLGHNTGGNESDHLRRILYFRLSAAGHAERWEETFLDCLTEYAPVRGATQP